MSFAEVNARYVDLLNSYRAGTLSADDFDSRLKEMMVQDSQGRWWAKSRESGQWHYYDGTNWVAADPPLDTSNAGRTGLIGGDAIDIDDGGGLVVKRGARSVSDNVVKVFMAVAVLFPIAGWGLWLYYRNNLLPGDREMAKELGLLGLGAFVLWTLSFAYSGFAVLFAIAGGGAWLYLRNKPLSGDRLLAWRLLGWLSLGAIVYWFVVLNG